MPATGGTQRSFILNGRSIHATRGRLVDEEGTLAGADLDMLSAVRNAHEMLGVALPQALAMASANPAFLSLGADLGRIAPGRYASLLRIAPDWRLSGRWIAGVPGD